MSATRHEVIVLGAGPAGLGAARKLAERDSLAVTVIERNDVVGGNAGSFELGGMRVDFGSHRLHPACLPEILDDIRSMLGSDLLDRPRHGRIRLRGRWLRFPLKPLDLLLHLPPSFVAGVARDAVTKRFAGGADESFAAVLRRSLGPTVCRDFYFPYAQKIWGVPPDELDAEQARRRVSANSIGKVVRKVLHAVPGLKPPDSGRFFYPRGGYGQISEAYHRAAVSAGASVELGTTATALELENGRAAAVTASSGERQQRYPASLILSTIPITILARAMRPRAPDDVLEAAGRMRYRAMILVYLVLGADRFSEYDAHYFPGLEIPITRLSEPKNYGLAEVAKRTVLCAELPCSTDESRWGASDDELGDLVLDSLATAGLSVDAPVIEVTTRRLPQAYPVYERGYAEDFRRVDGWLEQIDGLVSFGRQGLFVHDNTHHTLAMAYKLADCIDGRARLDRHAWQRHREWFKSFVVED